MTHYKSLSTLIFIITVGLLDKFLCNVYSQASIIKTGQGLTKTVQYSRSLLQPVIRNDSVPYSTTVKPTTVRNTTMRPTTVKPTTLNNTVVPQWTKNCKCGITRQTAGPADNDLDGGQLTPLIVGGENAPEGAYRWHAVLVRKGTNIRGCGATLINDRWVLTAAHCSKTSASRANRTDVILNAYEWNSNRTTPALITIRRRVDKAIIHPASTLDNDFALLRLAEPVDLTSDKEPFVTPICLPEINEKSSFAGRNATVVGWGITAEKGKRPNILQEVQVPIISNDECNITRTPSKSVTKRMMCAGFKEGGKDSCNGDSGGPLTITDNVRHTIVGVVSGGEGCARKNKPGIYSRVTEANEWIRKTSSDAIWCDEE